MDSIYFPLIVGLTMLGCLSPLLTFARFAQMKEWRWDRLREGLRNEGWLRPLFGMKRPAAFLFLFLLEYIEVPPADLWPIAPLGVFAGMAVAQIGLRLQPLPVWTMKARVIVTTGILADLGIAAALYAHSRQISDILLTLLPLSQAVMILLAMTLWKPLDAFLKRRIMAKAAAVRAAMPDATVIGITGSVGKTTTKELLAHVLAEQKPLVTPAYVNSEMGVSHWLLEKFSILNSQFSILIVEMGAYRKGEIKTLCEIAKPTIGVLTFIGRQHIALFGSQEALVDAKAELVEAIPADGRVFLNGDSALCASVQDRSAAPVTVVGTGGRADCEAFDIEETGSGIRFTADGTRFEIPLHGTHNVTNVLLAIAVARHLGMRDAAIAERLRSFRTLTGTFQVRKERGVTILDDTHNSSPESVRAAIAWAKALPPGSKVLCMSGIIELGESSARIHAEIGKEAQGTFERVIVLDKKCAQDLASGLGEPVEVWQKTTSSVAPGTLLLCCGRIPNRIIQSLISSL